MQIRFDMFIPNIAIYVWVLMQIIMQTSVLYMSALYTSSIFLKHMHVCMHVKCKTHHVAFPLYACLIKFKLNYTIYQPVLKWHKPWNLTKLDRAYNLPSLHYTCSVNIINFLLSILWNNLIVPQLAWYLWKHTGTKMHVAHYEISTRM